MSNLVVIVTGGGGGIGRQTSLALGRAGAQVVVVGRAEFSLAETVSAIREQGAAPPALALPLDVRSEADMETMARDTLARFGRIDALVTCAGILSAPGEGPRPVAELPAGAWDTTLTTNLTGVFLSNRAVLPAMMAQGRGDIINLSSTSGRRGQAYAAAYSASKAAVIGFSESLAEEVRSHGIRVQVLVTGPVQTRIWEQNRPFPPPEQALPPERVADLIVYVLSRPTDTVLPGAVIAPFRPRRRPAWRAAGAAAVRA